MIEYKGIKWRLYQGVLIPLTAPHVEIKLSMDDEKELLKRSGAYFLRYVSDWDSTPKTDFWYVIKDEKEDISTYKSKMRNQIKKGLKNCIVEIVDSSFIATNGYEVYKKAAQNYKNFTMLEKKEFVKHILSSNNEFWAVFEKSSKKLIAYSQNIIEDSSINYATIKFDPAYLRLYPSYALFYEMNRYYLNEKQYKYVNDGSRSLSHDTNIQDFLIQKFKFRKSYCKLYVVYRRDIEFFVKCLYPFKTFFYKQDNNLSKKISLLLKHEELRRGTILNKSCVY